MNAPLDGDAAHATEPIANSTKEPSSTFLRPYRSPSKPSGSIAAANTSRYADENHCRSDADACSFRASVGSATLRTVASRPTATPPITNAPSAHHRRTPTPRRSATEPTESGISGASGKSTSGANGQSEVRAC
jgi:hypothetical protein